MVIFSKNIICDKLCWYYKFCAQVELRAPKEVANECPLKSFRFNKSKETPTDFYEIKTGHLNSRTPWW